MPAKKNTTKNANLAFSKNSKKDIEKKKEKENYESEQNSKKLTPGTKKNRH